MDDICPHCGHGSLEERIPGFVVRVAAGWIAVALLQVPAVKYGLKMKKIRKSQYSVRL